MKNHILSFLILLFFCIAGNAEAKLRQYINPYDISEIEWQVLNWTAAWRDTATPADPFILERIEYDRREADVHVYLRGKNTQDTEENLKKSIEKINKLFIERFPKFELNKDLIVSYKISPGEGGKVYNIEYNNGTFNRTNSIAQDSDTQMGGYN